MTPQLDLVPGGAPRLVSALPALDYRNDDAVRRRRRQVGVRRRVDPADCERLASGAEATIEPDTSLSDLPSTHWMKIICCKQDGFELL